MAMQEIPWYEEARRLGREGRADEALAVLRAGLDAGSWYNPEALVTDPDLGALGTSLEAVVQ